MFPISFIFLVLHYLLFDSIRFVPLDSARLRKVLLESMHTLFIVKKEATISLE
jgi:hypothetical protein